jgi:hypothetical protein
MGKSHRSILSVTGTVPPPRRPNDDDDDDGDTDGFKIHRGVLGLEEAEGTYNDRHFIEAAAFPM